MTHPRLTAVEIAEALAAYEPLIWKLARQAARYASRHDLEDVASVVRLQFLAAAAREEFDPSRGKLGTYVGAVPFHQARRFLSTERTRGISVPPSCRSRFPRVLSLEAPLGRDHDAGTSTLADTLPSRPETEQPAVFVPNFWDVVAETAGLTRDERAAVEMRFRRDMGFGGIAKATGTSAARVKLVFNLAMNKLRGSADRLASRVVCRHKDEVRV